LNDFVIAETAPSVPEQTPGSHPATVGDMADSRAEEMPEE
jgi:hypothetical protein